MRTHRRLHLVDVENLVGRGRVSREEVERCSTAYLRLGIARPGDLHVLGCNPKELLEVGLGWCQPHRIVTAHGPNGADEALLAVIRMEQVEQRFDEVLVASGDGIFADAVVKLQRGGLRVTVVAPITALARRLEVAAGNRLVPFPQLHPDAVSAADLDLVQAA
jgi:hypothetical protein